MGKPSPPTPPDPYQTAAAQTGTNVSTAVANAYMGNANVNNPYGSSYFTQTGTRQVTDPTTGRSYDVPTFQQDIRLSPAEQTKFNQQEQLGIGLNNIGLQQTSKIGNLLSTPIDSSTLPGRVNSVQSPTFGGAPTSPALGQNNSAPFLDDVNLQTGNYGSAGTVQRNVPVQSAQSTFANTPGIQMSAGPSNYTADAQRVQQAIMSRMQPEMDRERAALESKLVNQGLARGSTGFQQQMDEFNRQQNDANQQAVLAGYNQSNTLANLALQQGQFANSAQQQAYNEALGRGSFANSAAQQNNAANLSAGQFANQAQGQAMDQLLAQRAADNSTKLSQAGFNDQVAQQEYQNYLQNLGFNNQVSQQRYQNDLQNQQFNNANAQNQFNNSVQAANFQNANRGQALQEQLSLRNQPINEISALMSGGQVSLPQFQGYQFQPMQPAPVGQYIYNSAALNNQNYQTQQSQQNAMMGGLFGLGSAGILGGMMPIPKGGSSFFGGLLGGK